MHDSVTLARTTLGIFLACRRDRLSANPKRYISLGLHEVDRIQLKFLGDSLALT